MIKKEQLASLLIQTGTSATVGKLEDRVGLLILAQSVYKMAIEESAHTALGCAQAMDIKDMTGEATAFVVYAIRKLGENCEN